MIPISLRLKNFGAHYDSFLDFRKLDPISLIIGVINNSVKKSNGAGKSYVFEGLTYALYDKTRVSGNKDINNDNLVRGGTNKMEVEYLFEEGDTVYRVRRSWDKSKRIGQQSGVRFDQQIGSKWQAVASGKTNINKKIIEVVGIDYDVFFNSVFFKQDAVTGFADMTSTERKNVVSNILQLEKYDKYAKEARNRLVVVKDSIEEINSSLLEHDDVDVKLVGYREELKAIKEKLITLASDIKKIEKEISTFRTEQSEFNKLNLQRERLQETFQKLEEDVKSCLGESEKNEKLLQERKEQLKDLETKHIEVKKRFIEASQGVTDREELKIRVVKAKQEKDVINNDFDEKNNEYIRVEQSFKMIDKRLNEFQKTSKEYLDLDYTVDEEEEALNMLISEQGNIQKRYKVVSDEYDRLNKLYISEQKSIEIITDKLKDIDIVEEGECPTCFSIVTSDSKEERRKVIQKELSTQEFMFKKTKKDFESVTENEAHAAVALDEIKGKVERSQERLKKRKEVESDLQNIENEHNNLQRQFMKVEKEYKAVKVRKDNFDKDYEVLKKEAEEYNQMLLEKKNAAGEMETLVQRQQHMKESIENTRQLITQYDGMANEKQDEKERVWNELQKIKDVNEGELQQLNNKIQNANDRLEELKDKERTYNRREGSLSVEIKQVEDIIDQLKQKRNDLNKLRKKERVLQELALAFSKNGIQALILENSTVEIENIVNEFLDKLTGGYTHVRIETQRDAKTSEKKVEIFEPIVVDPYHSNPIQLYSGGEKFRIAFAIRIALSKLLLRRAGSSCGFIFYDEAFNSLDSDGIERLIDAFLLLSSSFPYQVIVTHQTELKREFNCIVTVNKTNQGSTIVQN